MANIIFITKALCTKELPLVGITEIAVKVSCIDKSTFQENGNPSMASTAMLMRLPMGMTTKTL